MNQFFNFGIKPTNAVKSLKVNYYTSGVVTDSTVSNFSSYILSRDNYVTPAFICWAMTNLLFLHQKGN
ncbi:MAG: hypothetical protein WDM90_21540 [Ferruginibacter sp.]